MTLRFLSLLALSVASAQAAVTLPSCFSEHMVLQRDAPIPVWGRAAPGEKVSVQLGTQPAATATAGADGKWKVALPKSAAGGPFTLAVRGTNEIKVGDVLVGEVWLCSGQSNMEFTVSSVNNAAAEIAAANDPQIRQYFVPKRVDSQPNERLDAAWTPASPATVGSFTACGYFMARGLRKELGVPIGLIHSSWGGTRIEPWTPASAFSLVPALKDLAAQVAALDPKNPEYQRRYTEYLGKADAWLTASRTRLGASQAIDLAPELDPALVPFGKRPAPEQQPTTLYNGMIHAVVGYGLRGAIWYQGESNHVEGKLYTEKMKALIGGWRQVWGLGEFPFNFVQIAPFRYNEDVEILPKFWVAQSAALAIPNTGMVVTNDIGTLDDIHPRNKQEVGRRLALLALARTYGKSAVVCNGPTFKSVAIEGGKVRVLFDHATGLRTRDQKPPTWFEIVGDEGEWAKADAVIAGESVLVSSPHVAKPVAVRFAWHRDAEPNLVNAAGLPTAAFVSGSAPYRDPLDGRIPEAKSYQLVYGLDLHQLGTSVTYEPDLHAQAAPAFDRVGYLLELQKDGGPLQFAWASFDAVTTDLTKIALPTYASGARFQQPVKNLVVTSNVNGVKNGQFAEGGNIEFWPYNYSPANIPEVPGASSAAFDFGDQIGEGPEGYGCLQIHNAALKQTVLAINHFVMGDAGADLGIGNSTSANPDWTFTQNSAAYSLKKLRIFIRPKSGR